MWWPESTEAAGDGLMAASLVGGGEIQIWVCTYIYKIEREGIVSKVLGLEGEGLGKMSGG